MHDSISHDDHQGTLAAVRKELDLPDSVNNDLEGLRTVYAAWCNNMTFDNMRKFVSLRAGDERLAGSDANDYFASADYSQLLICCSLHVLAAWSSSR